MRRAILLGTTVFVVLQLFAVLSVRLIRSARPTTTGWETVQMHWTSGLFRESNPWRDPRRDSLPEDAEFRIAETNRVTGEHPEDAELAMGAAMAVPGKASREFAARAVAIDPANVNLRRLQAVLLEGTTEGSGKPLAYDRHALETLAECRRRDPDNALYDYIIAADAWNASVEFAYDINGAIIDVGDRELFDRGVKSFEAGLSKSMLAFPRGDEQAHNRFLKLARISNTERGKRLGGVTSQIRYHLLETQYGRARERSDDDDPQGALALFRESLRVREQLALGDPHAAKEMHIWDSEDANGGILWLNAEVDLGLPANERSQIEAECYAVALANKLYWAIDNVVGTRDMEYDRATKSDPTWMASSFALTQLPRAIAFSLALGVVFLIAARFFGQTARLAPGLFAQGFWLLAALVMTAVAVGLAPAHVIPYKVEAWGTTVLILAVLPIGTLAFGLLWLKRRRFRFRMLDLMLAVFSASCLFAAVAALWRYTEFFSQFPFHFRVPSSWKDSYDLDRRYQWVVALWEWCGWCGFYATLVLWLAALSIALFRRHQRRAAAGEAPDNRVAAYCGDWSRMIGRSLAAVGVVLLPLYLYLAPVDIAHVERAFQQSVMPIERPEEAQAQHDADRRAVASNSALMAELRAKARRRINELNGRGWRY